MPEEKALVPLKDLQIEEIFKDKKTRGAILGQIKDYALQTTFDITTTKGRAACISHAMNVSRSANAVDEKGLELTKGMRAEINKVNEIRKEVKDFLKPIAIEARAPVTAWEKEKKQKEEAEKKRIENIKRLIEEIKGYEARNDLGDSVPLHQATADQAAAAIKGLYDIEINEGSFAEFLDEAEDAQALRAKELSTHVAFKKDQEKLEAEKRELAEEKKRVEEKAKQVENEAKRIKGEAEQREAQRIQSLETLITNILSFDNVVKEWTDAKEVARRISALEKVAIDESYQERQEEARDLKRKVLTTLREGLPFAEEADKKAAESLRRKAEKEAERKVKAKEAEKLREQQEREADTEHRRKINRKIIDMFVSASCPEELAIEILKAIVRSKQPFISVNY